MSSTCPPLYDAPVGRHKKLFSRLTADTTQIKIHVVPPAIALALPHTFWCDTPQRPMMFDFAELPDLFWRHLPISCFPMRWLRAVSAEAPPVRIRQLASHDLCRRTPISCPTATVQRSTRARPRPVSAGPLKRLQQHPPIHSGPISPTACDQQWRLDPSWQSL